MTAWGWAGSVREFLQLPMDPWVEQLAAHHRRLLSMGMSGAQATAWADEYAVMRDAFSQCCQVNPEAVTWSVVFEYELPLEGGRRPDVVVLAGASVVVLEFKSTRFAELPQIDQVSAYARDLADYHEATHGRRVVPILVLPAAGDLAVVQEDVTVTGPGGLARYIHEASGEGTIDLPSWLNAPYAPLPTLVAAARQIFRDEPLPHVKTALAAGIPEAIELLVRVTEEAAQSGDRVMVFVTGVPGAGKTLVGLRFVYERSETAGRATFLSGNGPLVAVLQDALKSRAFVRDLHAFIRTYGLNQKQPKEKVLVFDEAQRAWDSRFMEWKKGVASSEPELLVDIGERIPEWSALIGLVGEGQEIHSGEEGGLTQWRDAIANRQTPERWKLHCPPKLVEDLAPLQVTSHPELDLTISLRSRRAENLHDWVRHLLEGSVALAARLATRIHDDGYRLYVTRNLLDAKRYATERYENEGSEFRFGLLASSHAKSPPKYGVPNSFMATSRMNIAKWFNAPPDDPKSCCDLTQPVTEFGCQGLELDLPLLCWGEDFLWTGSSWKLKPIRRKYPLDDPERILKNTYRVLLTRGRDGLIAFVPPDPLFDLTEHALLAAGLKPLPAESKEAEGIARSSAV